MADDSEHLPDKGLPDEGLPDDRYPVHPPKPEGFQRSGRRRPILMTPKMAAIGSLLAFFAVVGMVVVLPTQTFNPPPSANWTPLTDEAQAGRAVYLANGCVYCHSGFSRPQDVFQGRYYLYPRASLPGDYHGTGDSPNILGSQRTGPDLSQEAGMHPDEWHVAHYENPRFTMPNSIMPRFGFWSEERLANMIAFNQMQGGKEGVLRHATQTVGNKLMAVNRGNLDPAEGFPDFVELLQEFGEYRPDGKPSDKSPWGLPWKAVYMVNTFDRGYWLTDNPLPATQTNLMSGKREFLNRCVGCHGVDGGGDGPAAQFFSPKPFDFTAMNKIEHAPMTSDGMFYHRILTGGPGTAMENFGTRLSVEDIWRVVLFLRTIPQGGLASPETLPTPDMYVDWQPPGALLRYIEDHPLSEQDAGWTGTELEDPFLQATRWLVPGMDGDDVVVVGGKLPVTTDRIAELIEQQYFRTLAEAYDEAQARGEVLPPREQVVNAVDLQWHSP